MDQTELLKRVATTRRRELHEPYNTIVTVIASACGLFVLYGGLTGTIYPYLHRATFLGFVLPLIFFLYPATQKTLTRHSPTIIDILLSLAAIFSVSVAWYNIERIMWRIPYIAPIYTIDIVSGVILIFCVLEACRRVLGWALVTIGGVFLAYGLWGQNLPGMLSHGGVTYRRLIEFLILGSDGVFSSITGIGATFLFTFIMFGTFISVCGIGDMVFNIAKILAKGSVGAPAKIAVISSAFMASISGSTLANVVTTGSITIPMMKKGGFRNYEAAAFETAASVGGQITPPIMGAGVFIMSEFTGLPLIEIIKLSILPALLYYVSVYVFVNNRIKIRSMTGEIHDIDIGAETTILDELKQRGILLLALVLLMTMMVRGFSAYYSSSLTIVVAVLLSFVSKHTRMTVKEILGWLRQSTINALTVAAILATAAIIVGVIFQTGFVVVASSAIINLAQGVLWITIVLTILMSYVLGMSLPITAAYILISIMGVPAFVYLGVPVISAHLAIFWFSQDSTITPPVCMTAFVAADIAEAPRYKTGFTSLMFAKGLYIVPFLFIYTDLITGSFIERLADAGLAALGMILFTIALDGFWNNFIKVPLRLIAAFGAFLAWYTATFEIFEGESIVLVALTVIVFLLVTQYYRVPILKKVFLRQVTLKSKKEKAI